MATNIYDVLAGQSAIDVFNEDVYPTGDPETRGGMYSRAKGYGGLAQLANLYLEMAGLPPTQENYDMAFRALGAGAPVPVAEELPEGKSAMVAYFDRLLGRTPEEEKKETIKEIMVEDESSEPDLSDTSEYPYDPTDWRDITREEYDLYPSYNFIDLAGRVAGLPSAVAGKISGSAEANKAKKEKVQEILEQIYSKEVVDAYNKQKKDEGLKFSFDIGKAVQGLFGITDPAAALYEDEIGYTKGLSKALGLEGLGLTANETFLETSAAEAKLNKEAAERQAREAVEYEIGKAYENYMAGNITQARYNQLMELGNLDPDTGEPNEPTGDMTGKTGSELVDLISDIGLWGPDDPSAYDPSDLHSDLQKALGHGDPIAAALGPAGYGMTQDEIDKAAAALGKGYRDEQKELDKRSAEARAKENKPGGDDVNADTGKTTDQELTEDWEDDPDAMF